MSLISEEGELLNVIKKSKKFLAFCSLHLASRDIKSRVLRARALLLARLPGMGECTEHFAMIRVPPALALLVTICVLAGCSDLGGPMEKRVQQAENAEPTTPIRIGVPAPWEIISDLGHYREGLELALKEINKDKVLGRRIELVWKDDQASLSQGRAVAQEFAENPDIVAVLGHYNSFISVPVSLIYQHYGVLMMTATSTANRLTSREGLDLVFRNIPNDQQAASQLADFADSQGFRRIIVLNQDNAFGNSLANAFEIRSEQIGMNVVDRRSYDVTSGETYFRRIIQTWQDFYRFDAIFLAGVVPKAAKIITLARLMGVDVPILGGDGLDSPQLWEIGGDLMDGVIVGTYFHPQQSGEKVQGFVQGFRSEYGVNPDSWAAQSYATLHLLARAMREAESTVPSKVSTALKNMAPYQSILGHTEFNAQGDVVGRSITTKIVHNRQFEFLGLNASQPNPASP
jgi:branched-chain amino acid transport system substrate-binding protein